MNQHELTLFGYGEGVFHRERFFARVGHTGSTECELLETFMKLKKFRIRNYRSILDSGWVDVDDLTVLVGKNEAGKTSLLRALHKLNPFEPTPYRINREWPRGYRADRDGSFPVCVAVFALDESEAEELGGLLEQEVFEVTVTRNYDGELEVGVDASVDDLLHPNDVDRLTEKLPEQAPTGSKEFREVVKRLRDQATRAAAEGRFQALKSLPQEAKQQLKILKTEGDSPEAKQEQDFIKEFVSALQTVSQEIEKVPTVKRSLHEFVEQHLPTFVYMDEYRVFEGKTLIDQLFQRKKRGVLTAQDETILMVFQLAGLDLEQEVQRSQSTDIDEREERAFDLKDASATLTRLFSAPSSQRRYEIELGLDQNNFFLHVRDEKDPSLIRLDERSKGFQWYFSFDLLFMYESEGEFEGCVLLLDEPGLHLHPGAQRELVDLLAVYAQKNTLLYTTHLPFMIDLNAPERIRIVEEPDDDEGTRVTQDLINSSPDAKLVLQAALGIAGRTSYLLGDLNLVVEGVDDYWILSALSALKVRHDGVGLPDELRISPAGGASEAVYLTALMLGQELDVVALLDSDDAGRTARNKLRNTWLTSYNKSLGDTVLLGDLIGVDRDASIEDLFTDSYYLDCVKETYDRQLAAHGLSLAPSDLDGGGMLVSQVRRFFETAGLTFNHGSVAKVLRRRLLDTPSFEDLPKTTQTRTTKLIEGIRAKLGRKT